MEQYINKAALVAWIESQIDSLERNSGCSGIFGETQMAVYDKLYSFLNTTEVKEVDINKEISNYLDNHNLNIQDGGRIVFNNGDTPNFLCDFRDIAKHFFELGIKAQKGE